MSGRNCSYLNTAITTAIVKQSRLFIDCTRPKWFGKPKLVLLSPNSVLIDSFDQVDWDILEDNPACL